MENIDYELLKEALNNAYEMQGKIVNSDKLFPSLERGGQESKRLMLFLINNGLIEFISKSKSYRITDKGRSIVNSCGGDIQKFENLSADRMKLVEVGQIIQNEANQSTVVSNKWSIGLDIIIVLVALGSLCFSIYSNKNNSALEKRIEKLELIIESLTNK